MNKHLTRIIRKIYTFSVPKRISTSLSDNQTYPQVCIKASNNYRLFNNFRRHPIYNQILEHVTEAEGNEYLQLISDDLEIMDKIHDFKANDEWGNPRTYDYPNIGTFSPSTLRYIKVLSDIKKHFGSLDNFDACEIGVGYGGQCRVINTLFNPASYCLVDIQPALSLTQRFLDNFIINSVLSYKTMNELGKRDYDFVMSNYAFTELPRTLQDVYLDKVILNSKRGYITYNEITPKEFRSYKAKELVAMIPGAKIFKEEPLSSPNNCIIVWGINI
ncbi:putative sugar O-methyltransferase [Colwellia piezophila]|uniref:putative sugar O-methyltransferase n=1 Tax=Colwellia piezophila TaxID=211668 RepID=UPI00039CAEC1|nr:putative sugar O-methyltransferase [Colwellia piezophila]